MGWQIVYDGQTYRQDELSLDDADAIDNATDETWAVLHVQATPLRLAKVTAWLHARRTNAEYAEVLAKVKALPARTFIADHFGEAPDDLPDQWADGFPQPAADPETTGSSGV